MLAFFFSSFLEPLHCTEFKRRRSNEIDRFIIIRIIKRKIDDFLSVCIAAKILLFYVIFYAVLAGFFGAMLTVFYQTLDPNAPKWQLDNSLIGSNPGLGFRPMPPESNVESTLIWYKASDEGNFLHWTRELDKFLEGNFIFC